MMQMFGKRNILQYLRSVFSTHWHVMSFHSLKHHAVVFTLWPARQRWVPLWKLQSWHFGSIPALQCYCESKLQVHPINPPAKRIHIWWFVMIYVNKKRFASVLLIWLLFPTDSRGWQFHRISHLHLNHTMSITPKSTSLMLERFCFRCKRWTWKLWYWIIENVTSYQHISIPARGQSGHVQLESMGHGCLAMKVAGWNPTVPKLWHLRIYELKHTFSNLPFWFDGPKDFKGNLRRVKESIQDGISCTMSIWLKC